MKTYKFNKHRGIDDLLSEYAFIGNSQGDTHATNSIGEYKNSDGWLSFIFGTCKDIDVNDQEAINKESERRKKYNQDYIKSLQDSGKYGEEYEVEIHLQENPIFDKHIVPGKDIPLESYRIVFIDDEKYFPNTQKP